MKVSEIDWFGRGQRRFDLPGSFDDQPEDRNPREVIGGNNPPPDAPVATKLDEASITMGMMTAFLNDTPVIQDEKAATAAKVQIENARGALAEMDAERDGKVRPLNERVATINGAYKAVAEPLKAVMAQVRARLSDYLKALEAERERIAAEARRKAEEAERLAREAEAREREAIENAAAGEVDAGVAEKIVEADAAFSDFKVANRDAARAERDANNTRVGGGFGRSMGLRTQTTLTLTDPLAAIKDMGGVSEKASEALLSDARAFKKLHKRWPAGVTAAESRGV